MTALAASLFAFGAMISVWIIGDSWKRYGPGALALKARLAACPATLAVSWQVIERVQIPRLAPLRPDRQARSTRALAQRPALEWPGAGCRPLGFAA